MLSRIQINFYKADNGNWLDKIIAKVSKFYAVPRLKYLNLSHVEITFPESLGGLSFSSSPRDGGTRFKKIDMQSGHWENVNLYTERSKEMCDKASTLLGKKYDFQAILGFGIPFVKQNDNKIYCVEAVKAVLSVDPSLYPSCIAKSRTPLDLYDCL